MKTWEYLTMFYDEFEDAWYRDEFSEPETFNKLGSERWELVSVIPETEDNTLVAFFKREVVGI